MKRPLLLRILTLFIILTMLFPLTGQASFYILNGVRFEEPDQPDIKLLLDGKELTTDVPPVIVDNRTLVPARKIFESMGAKVDWIAAERRVVITGDVKVELVIDQKEASVDGESRTLDVPATLIDDRTMVPVRFVSECLACDVDWIPETRTVTIVKPKGDFTHTLKKISYEWEEYEGRLRVALTFDQKNVNFSSFTLKEPDRLVVDMEKTLLGTTAASPVETECPMVPSIRFSQFSENPMTVRVVVDLTEAAESVISKTPDGKSLYIDFQYQGDRIYLYDDPPTIVCGGAEEADLTMKEEDGTVTVTVAKMTYDEETLAFENEFCESVEVTMAKNKSYLTIQLKEGASAALSGNRILFWKGDSDQLSDLTLNSKAKELLVVIDPGHGGAETGSVGYDEDGEESLYEKKVNLQIALRANTLLKQMGVKTLMTRMTDTDVSLSERAEIANKKDAALFVSVHNNSFTSADAMGSEVLYGSDEVLADYGISGKRLAELIQKEMVQQLERPDRGVKHTPGMAVIRLSKMPAVIVEGLFLSNPEELAMLKDPEYVERQAVAIARGIVRALNEMATYEPPAEEETDENDS